MDTISFRSTSTDSSQDSISMLSLSSITAARRDARTGYNTEHNGVGLDVDGRDRRRRDRDRDRERRGRGRRGARGADIDAGGRRAGERDPDDEDVDGEAGDKDELPAYDAVGSPPQYDVDGPGEVVGRRQRQRQSRRQGRGRGRNEAENDLGCAMVDGISLTHDVSLDVHALGHEETRNRTRDVDPVGLEGVDAATQTPGQPERQSHLPM